MDISVLNDPNDNSGLLQLPSVSLVFKGDKGKTLLREFLTPAFIRNLNNHVDYLTQHLTEAVILPPAQRLEVCSCLEVFGKTLLRTTLIEIPSTTRKRLFRLSVSPIGESALGLASLINLTVILTRFIHEHIHGNETGWDASNTPLVFYYNAKADPLKSLERLPVCALPDGERLSEMPVDLLAESSCHATIAWGELC